MRNMSGMYDDVLIPGRSPHFSAENEIIAKVPTPRNISSNSNWLILFTKYGLKNSYSLELSKAFEKKDS